jgi:hypothetical protein
VVAARPPPPPPPRILPAGEAVAIAAQYARSRGVVVDYTEVARLDRARRWHVDLGGAGGRDHARVVLDGWSGRILHARLRASGRELVPQPPPGGAPPPPMPPQAGGEPPPPAPPPVQGQPGGDAAPPPGSQPPSGAPPPPPSAPPPPPAASGNP